MCICVHVDVDLSLKCIYLVHVGVLYSFPHFRMSCAVSIGVLTLQDVLNTTILFSLSVAWQLGRVVECARRTHSNVLQAIARQQSGTVLLVGKVRHLGYCDLFLRKYWREHSSIIMNVL